MCNGTFATLASSDQYANSAICLHQQLRAVGSRCPLLVVTHDLSDDARARLQAAVGRQFVLSLSDLSRRVQSAMGLVAPTRWTYRTHAKLWLWALPPMRFPKVVMMDSDMLILRNIDDLLAVDLNDSQPIAAVPCAARAFQSGVVAFRPSPQVLKGLLFFARFMEFPWHGRMPFVGGIHARPTAWRPELPQLQPWALTCGELVRNASRGGVNGSALSTVFSDCRHQHAKGGSPSYQRAALYCEWRHGDQSILNAYFSRGADAPAT